MTQERRRYGFVLERQCSIAKHWMAYHTTGKQVIDNHLENWQEIATSREMLPTTVYDGTTMLMGNKRLVGDRYKYIALYFFVILICALTMHMTANLTTIIQFCFYRNVLKILKIPMAKMAHHHQIN